LTGGGPSGTRWLPRGFLEPGGFGENFRLSVVSALVELANSILSNLAVPLVASITAYAGYRTIVLYSLFVGTLNLGFANGLYLHVLGRPVAAIRSQVVQRVINVVAQLQVILIPALGLLLASSPRLWRYGWPSLIVALIGFAAANISGTYASLLKGAGLFRCLTVTSLIGRAASLVILVPALLLRRTPLIVLAVAIAIPVVMVTMFQYVILRPRPDAVQLEREETSRVGILKRGFPLYFSTVCMALLFNVDNLLVSISFSSELFAVYAFAFGLTSVTYSLADSMTAAAAFSIARSLHERSRVTDPSFVPYVISLWCSPLLYWFGSALVTTAYARFSKAEGLLFIFAGALPFGLLLRSRVVAEATATAREWPLAWGTGGGLAIVASAVGLGLAMGRDLEGVALGWAIGTAMAAALAVLSSGAARRLLAHAAGASMTFLCCTGLLTGVGRLMGFVAVAAIALTVELRRERVASPVA
jgi:hypothetical protein